MPKTHNEHDSSRPVVVVHGNPFAGLNIRGPFDDAALAGEYGQAAGLESEGDGWWIVSVEAPTINGQPFPPPLPRYLVINDGPRAMKAVRDTETMREVVLCHSTAMADAVAEMLNQRDALNRAPEP